MSLDSHEEKFRLSSKLVALENRHSVEILLYVLNNNGCKKTDVYGSILRSASTQSRLQLLLDEGLLEIKKVSGSRADFLYLTEVGEKLAFELSEINNWLIKEGF